MPTKVKINNYEQVRAEHKLVVNRFMEATAPVEMVDNAFGGGLLRKAGSGLKKVGSRIKSGASSGYSKGRSAGAAAGRKIKSGAFAAGRGIKTGAGAVGGAARKAGGHVKSHKVGYAAGAGAAGAAGGAGYLAGRRKRR